MFKIGADKLMLVAGIVWLAAGLNIANIGVGAYLHEAGWLILALACGSFAVFALFHTKIFTKMVRKHAARIRGYGKARTNIFKFFDGKGYVMMGIMMGGGIALRLSGAIPEWFIASFYTGIGVALAVAGVSFLMRYFRKSEASCPAMPQATQGR